ncbi:glycoside hydrolase family 3 C-terminal domain-containing protein [Microbacterium sp. Marseille-Q6965]|uniref:glycoside hydrolase family 3 C-terminal domain-containing protein n=1 Tax=Microbacterium sp. Marseille-Q6965 TaxID=2965072 RepID=UPI0021B7CB5E|nr:glycoside hydrolase family 3 C-terminal domain-containing protein [Microbacterium sp. Marseille-Q6965]
MTHDDTISHLSLLEKAALLSGENTWQTRAVPRLGIDRLWLADGPHGVRKQTGAGDHLGIAASEPATCFPTAATVANSWDEELAERIGTALGQEARAQGVNVLLGPGLNIKRSPLGGRSFEYFSEDPELSGRLAAAYVRGIQSQGVAATPKHFAANSQELRRMASDSVLDERTLREIYLTAFEIVVREARPWAIMSSYNLVNGTYAHENAHLLQDVLRSEWGFDGAVISDWGGGNDAVAAVAAGGTLEMPSPGFTSAREIVAAVESGELAESDLDDRVRELLVLIERTANTAARRAIDVAGHHALARRAAAESAVLLRNADAVLPLAAGTRVALIGDFAQNPRYQGAGSSLVNATRVTNLVDAVAASPLALTGHAQGFRRDGAPEPALVSEAARVAREADIAIVCLGLPETAESEGMDRSTLEVPRNQVETLRAVAATGVPVVVILSAGGAVETPWAREVAALIHAYLGGQAGAEALVDILTGTVNPSGRLAETLPVTLADTPTAGAFPEAGAAAEYREGPFVGYRWYESVGADVAFEFGFGLSYTTFAYRDLVATGDEVSFTLENTGSVPGAEVAQLYVARSDAGRVPRPALELAGFRKVRLEPGESRTVTIPLPERALRFYDVETGSWQVEAGRYEVRVGASARDIRLRGAVDVAGTVPAGSPDPALAAYPSPAARVTDEAFAALLGRGLPRAADGGAIRANDPLLRLADSPSPVGRLIHRVLDGRRAASERRGKPDLNMLFLLNMPFRAIAKMSGGLATPELVDGVLTLANGRTLRGLGRIVRAFVRGRSAERRTRRSFETLSGGRA